MSIVTSLRRSGHGPWLLASSLVLAVLVAPFAGAAGEGKPLRIGKRNPSKSTVNKATQVIGKTRINAYTIRTDNRGAGGALALNCRSALGADVANPAVSTACLRSSNALGGEAFQFHGATTNTIGVIQSGANFAVANPNARPFVTNATGEAVGLNADKVDGLNAADIINQAKASNPIAGSPSFAFARVAVDGTTDQSRTQGVTNDNVKKGTQPGAYCFYSLSARPKVANVTLDGVAGETAVDTTTKDGAPCPQPIAQLDMHVRTFNSDGTPADKPFYVTITGTGS